MADPHPIARQVVWSGDRQAEGYVVLRRFLAEGSQDTFDLVDVRTVDPPIRTASRFAVVRFPATNPKEEA